MSTRVVRGRLQAYAYGVVTTTLFLIFAVTESLTEGYVAQHSRVAGTLIEIGIVVALALAFRPFHTRIDEWIEHAFTKRRREARDALARLRKELTSFNDVQQVLRRVVEAVDHHMGTGGSAIYLRHGAYDVEASTFDVAVISVEPDDALVVRLRSSAAPADPRALNSAALGDLAFPMMAGGELVGFLTLEPKHVEYDAEDRHALSTLAESTGIALLALDGRLRAQRRAPTKPSNLPRQSTSFVGRAAEVAAVEELVRNNPLVTIVGAGGVGKTRLALQAGEHLLEETTEGAWFVDLAPIGDGNLVASAILSVLGADQSGDAPPLERLVKHLGPRALLLILDNSEHLVAEIARVVDAVVTQCPHVAVLATSREPLGLRKEIIHRLASLDDVSAVQLFVERARAVNDRFELTETNSPIVAEICKHLDGMALAIELAAARVRSISVDELSHRLQLRVLGGFGREPLARHKTMHALIDWSYDLLTPQEQTLFVQLSPFVGGLTLEAAMATYCCDELDELQLLDLVTSLVDKSLLVADVEETSQRYRFLEPIREYARERLEKSGEAHAACKRYAETFAALADAAYEEFDSGPKPDWLERNARELDNVRAAMRWALDNGDHRDLAARLAGSFGVVFLRLTLLQEGIDLSNRSLAMEDAPIDHAIKARLYYVLSMLNNNQGRYASALTAAQCAADLYRGVNDARGIARSLSQVAQQLENNERPREAVAMGEAAVEAARALDDPGVLASVLGRVGNAFEAVDIVRARTRYAEAADIYRQLGRDAERSRLLYWWAFSEYEAGALKEAASLIEQSLVDAGGDLRISVTNLAAGIYWGLGDPGRAAEATKEAFKLAATGGDSIYLSDALSFMAMLAAERDPEDAARIFGYSEEQRLRFRWPIVPKDRNLWNDLRERLISQLSEERYHQLIAEGAAWSQDRAVTIASSY